MSNLPLPYPADSVPTPEDLTLLGEEYRLLLRGSLLRICEQLTTTTISCPNPRSLWAHLGSETLTVIAKPSGALEIILSPLEARLPPLTAVEALTLKQPQTPIQTPPIFNPPNLSPPFSPVKRRVANEDYDLVPQKLVFE